MRVLGIDPGLRLTGFGLVESAARSGSGSGSGVGAGRSASYGAVRLVDAGVLRFKAGLTVSARLAELERDLNEVIESSRPELVAVEKLYAHYAHPTTAIIMGHARGVVLLCVQKAGVELLELGATEVKKSLTGNGHASKRQMQEGVRSQMGLAAVPQPADVADAIAIALCGLRRRGR
jgi:crossover junction endodeoxyribonuclease RuvC